MVTELQGGWFSDVGGQFSQAIGLTPQQITHVTLVAWAHGYTGTNYYMMFGGTNLGDWGSADQERPPTTMPPPSANAAASARRYFAVQAMANFLKEHSAQLIRSEVRAKSPPIVAGQHHTSIFEPAKMASRFLFVFNNQPIDRAAGTTSC